MGQDHIGKSVERLLQSIEGLIGAEQSGAAPGNKGPLDSKSEYNKNINALEANWSRLRSQKGCIPKLVCAKTWTNAFLGSKLALRIGLVLAAVREQAEAAASGAVSRAHTYQLVITAGQAAFLLLHRSSSTANALYSNSSSSKADRRKGMEALAAMAQRGLMQVVADATGAISAFAASLRAAAGEPSQPASASALTQHGHMWQFTGSATAHLDGLMGPIADSVCQYTWIMVLFAAEHIRTAEDRDTDPHAISVTPEGTSIIGSLVASELVAAAAAAVVDCPCAGGFNHITLSRAACDAARAMIMLALTQKDLALHGGPEGRRLACGLLRATRHVAVRRLQVALLDQLAAHAGMGAELRGREEEAQEQADGWAGSSGGWWFAREEAQREQLLGPKDGEEEPVAGSPTAGWLEDRHCNTVSATLWAWRTAEEVQLTGEAGVPAAPPPVLRARLAARAAEALCRLCRGQGLKGAYAPAPQWELAMAPALVQSLLPTTEHVDPLPAATARSCLPHWLEAAGWAAALMSDATAAAMGRLHSTRRGEAPVHIMQGLAQEGSQAGTLDDVLALTDSLAGHEAYGASLHLAAACRAVMTPSTVYKGVQTLSAAAYQGVRLRVFRCGLAASLDHTLRLAYSAQDGGRADVASSLYRATALTGCIAYWGLAPLLPPEATADGIGSGDGGQDGGGGSGGSNAGGDGASAATGGGSNDGGVETEAHGSGGSSHSGSVGQAGGGCSTGGNGGILDGGAATPEAGDQLGLLLTLSKRAAMLTRALEAGAEAGTGTGAETGTACMDGQGEGQGEDERRQELMNMAFEVLAALGGFLEDLEREVRPRVQEVRGKGPEVGGGAADAAGPGPDAAVVDEAHEALALGARAASNLAATYAWQLAAEEAGGTVAAGESAVQPTGDQADAVLVVFDCLLRWCCPPMLLPPAQLLACQPHRLLAAACALPTEDEPLKQRFGQSMAMLVITLSAHKALSSRVRSWLVPPPFAAAVGTGGLGISGMERSRGRSEGSDGDGCAGCLAAPLQCAIQAALGQPFTAEALALLKLAAGEAVGPEGDTPCCPGGGDGGGAAGEADGGFQRHAAAAFELVQSYLDDPDVSEAQEPLPPDGSHGATDLLGREQGAGGNQPQPPQPLAAPTWPLPPPLVLPPVVLPPGGDLALPRLRVCGNPRCGNFGCEGEWALPLKQCGGCRAVRYCGADCQRAHWREGHKAECKALAAGVAST